MVLKNKKITYPCVYAVSAGMEFGPLPISVKYKISEETLINHVLKLMETRIKNRAVICWNKSGKKKTTQFWRDRNGKPYYEK